MTELLSAYFQRDLSETELDVLGGLLQGSEEHATEFARLGAAFYRAMHLREPGRPGRPGNWIAGSLGGAGVAAAWIVWQSLGRPPAPVPAPSSAARPTAIEAQTQPVLHTGPAKQGTTLQPVAAI